MQFICTNLVQTNLSPTHQSEECPWVPAGKERP